MPIHPSQKNLTFKANITYMIGHQLQYIFWIKTGIISKNQKSWMLVSSIHGIHYRIIFTISGSVADTWVDATFELIRSREWFDHFKQMYGFSSVFIFYI
jgi:hypothetical protein